MAVRQKTIKTQEKESKKNSINTDTYDAFSNLMARIGFGSANLSESAAYPLTRMSRNYQLLNSLFREHWVIRKIVSGYAEDMMKNWITLSCQAAPDYLDSFQKQIRKTRTQDRLLEAIMWGRLYGGAAAVIMVKGHEKILDQPLNLDQVMPDSYRGLLVLDRWSGITPGPDLCHDIDSVDFGMPSHYRITTVDAQTFNVHSSRVLRFIGQKLPFWERQAEIGWGASEVESVFDELKKRDNTSWNVAALVFFANLKIRKMPDLAQALSTGNQAMTTRLQNTLMAQNQLMSSMGTLVLGKDEEFDTKQFSFTGINDVLQTFMLDICGAAGYPMTILFGRSPAGMNATGESDLQNYYDDVGKKQEGSLRPSLEKLLPVVLTSTWGEVPDDFDFTFNPVQTPQADKRADLASKKTSSVVEVFNAGVISPKTALKELRQMNDETGMWSNVTDEDIDNASDEINPDGEAPDFGGMFGGKKDDSQKPEQDATSGLHEALSQAGLLSPLGDIKKASTEEI